MQACVDVAGPDGNARDNLFILNKATLASYMDDDVSDNNVAVPDLEMMLSGVCDPRTYAIGRRDMERMASAFAEVEQHQRSEQDAEEPSYYEPRRSGMGKGKGMWQGQPVDAEEEEASEYDDESTRRLHRLGVGMGKGIRQPADPIRGAQKTLFDEDLLTPDFSDAESEGREDGAPGTSAHHEAALPPPIAEELAVLGVTGLSELMDAHAGTVLDDAKRLLASAEKLKLAATALRYKRTRSAAASPATAEVLRLHVEPTPATVDVAVQTVPVEVQQSAAEAAARLWEEDAVILSMADVHFADPESPAKKPRLEQQPAAAGDAVPTDRHPC